MISRQALTTAIPYLGAATLFYTVTLLGWHLMPNGIWGLYSLSDGAWLAWIATSIVTWSAAFDLAPHNILQGLGSLYPPDTPWLNPGALVLSLPGPVWFRYYLSYSIYFLELLAAMIVFGRSLQLSTAKSAALGFLVCFILFPPYARYLVSLPYLSLGPYYAHLLALFVLLFALFQWLGRMRAGTNALIALAILATLGCAVISGAFKILPFGPVYALFGAALLAHELTRSSLCWKLGTAAALLLLAVILGFPEFYISSAKVSASDLFTLGAPPLDRLPGLLLEFLRGLGTSGWCSDPQVHLCPQYPVFAIHAAALAGAVACLIFGRGLERRLAVAMLAFLLILHAWPVATKVGLLGKLARISANYFHWAAYPFYGYFVIGLVSHGYRIALRGVRKLRPRSAIRPDWPGDAAGPLYRWLWLLAVPAAAVLVLCHIDTDYRLLDFRKTGQIPVPAIEQAPDNEITDVLAREIGLQPGAVFRGFATSYFGGTEGPLRERLGFAGTPFTPPLYYRSRFYLQGVYGNTFMSTEFWQNGIPTSNDYGQWITKPYYVFNREMFTAPTDQPALSELNPYRLDVKFQQAIGVRFLVTDAQLHDARLTLRAVVRRGASEPALRPEYQMYIAGQPQVLQPPHLPVYLYEISRSNIASYAPVSVHTAATAAASFEILKAPAFDPAVDVVVHEPIASTPLQPLISSSLSAERGRLKVTARSAGTSFLLLPIQFSHCLSVQSRTRSQSPRLVRANLVLTGIVLDRELDVELTFRFGPGKDVSCRQKDVEDFQRLDFSPWQTDLTRWPN